MAVKIISRIVIALLVLVLVVVPVAILQNINSHALQIALVAVASALFTLIISGLTNARAVELFVSGAT